MKVVSSLIKGVTIPNSSKAKRSLAVAAISNKKPVFPNANGKLKFPLGIRGFYKNVIVHGGPFPNFENSPNAYGLSLRENEKLPCSGRMPIQDFKVPSDPAVVSLHLKTVILKSLEGRDVYVGCTAGWGRTGLFMSLVSKAMGQPNPITYTRENYCSHAVETKEQSSYVANFNLGDLDRQWVERQARSVVLDQMMSRWGVAVSSLLRWSPFK